MLWFSEDSVKQHFAKLKWKYIFAFKSHDITYRANNHLTSPSGNTYHSQWCFTENVKKYIYLASISIFAMETRQGIIGSDKKESSGKIVSM